MGRKLRFDKDSKIAEKPITVLAVVLDKSGSMESIRDDTIGGFNSYFDGLKNSGAELMVLLSTFSKSFSEENVGRLVPSEKIVPLTKDTYRPGGSTPLYDCIGYTMEGIDQQLKSFQLSSKSPIPVLMVVLTDGQENASTKFTKKSILEMITSKEKEGWTVVYLGANQDAFAEGGAIGVGRGNTLGYTATGTGMSAGMSVLDVSTASYIARVSAGNTIPVTDFFTPNPVDVVAPAKTRKKNMDSKGDKKKLV